jgi:hypothetical protein
MQSGHYVFVVVFWLWRSIDSSRSQRLTVLLLSMMMMRRNCWIQFEEQRVDRSSSSSTAEVEQSVAAWTMADAADS